MLEVATRETSKTSQASTCAVRHPLRILSIDVTCPQPRFSRGLVYILTMMDYFTKFVEIAPLRNQEATSLDKAVVERICAVYGTFLRLPSDSGQSFESEIFRKYAIYWV